ncbi:Protein of unknown function [Auraticoccus monumenti]|uniref:DUF3180 domain-containing protein n=1 Tax=Auraticoccus monumenti TaxID=675864 RepID=A0A1G6RRR1_9ACTN|nr:Protein of unknown function [Auraticoccus monumenti]
MAVAVVIGALAGWGVAAGFRAVDAPPPQVPWLSPVALAVLVVFVALLARDVRRRVHERRERVDPARAVVWLALGKAAALGGAAVAGGYLAYGLSNLGQVQAEAPRERLLLSLLCALTGAALTLAGLALERACRVPGDDETPGGGPEGEQPPNGRAAP